MEKNEESRYGVGNFSYANKERAQTARREQEIINQLEAQIDYKQPEKVYGVYRKLLEHRMLHTPQGVLYLVHLQNYLFDHKEMLSGDIPLVPEELMLESGQEMNPKESGNAEKARNSEEARNLKEPGNSKETKYTKENRNTKKTKILKGQSEMSTAQRSERIVIVFLVIMIVAMFIINSMNDSPTILNYRKQIQNEYSQWQMQLEDKEQELREREAYLDQLGGN